ncbi:hypothetical protein [Roseateles sp.]|uniref:hypothetical protein n=1 Tax=Roseateles sp. TaxID=1971397 RepID=UPI002E08DFAA|nr:hypothetical protein [Roseateles sp.]
MPESPPATASRPAPPRLLSGAGGGRQATRTASTTATEATSFTATVPFKRPEATPSQAAADSAAAPLPRWLKGVVIGGVLLAVGMPVSVLLSRSMLVQSVLAEQSGSKAAMVCTGGDARALDDSSVLGWLFGGSYFQCGDWETRDARVQRERDQYEANYLARQRGRQGLN